MAGFRVLGALSSGFMLVSCGTILGLDDYSVSESDGGGGSGGSGGATVTSSGGAGGSAGTGGGSGVNGGGSGGDGGTATSAGGSNGGSTSSSGGASTTSTAAGGATSTSGGTTGDAGAAGAGREGCQGDVDCEDRNECRVGSCVDGECVVTAAVLGTACSAGFCNGVDGAEECLPCVDDATDTEVDSGCSDGAPRCELGAGDAYTCTGCGSNPDCDDNNECTTDVCDAGTCSNTSVSPGTSCSSGVCDGAALNPTCVVCLDDAAGLEIDTGCNTDTPVCEDGSDCIECLADTDCDDDNTCTTNDCDDGICEYSTITPGAPCVGGGGICNGVPGSEACGACLDTAGGTNLDLGCGGGAPICNDSVSPTRCTGCLENSDCDDGIDCTVDTCSSGACSSAPNDNLCASSGTLCDPMVCTSNENTSDGCEPVSDRYSESLLLNGGLESGAQNWTQNYPGSEDPIIGLQRTSVAPQAGNWLAWMGGLDGGNPMSTYEDELWQVVSVPSNAVDLNLQFYYYIYTTDFPGLYDRLYAELRNSSGANPTHQYVSFSNLDETTAWQMYSGSYSIANGEAGSNISLFLRSVNDGTYFTSFYVDTISLTAVCCGAPCN